MSLAVEFESVDGIRAVLRTTIFPRLVSDTRLGPKQSTSSLYFSVLRKWIEDIDS